MKKLGFGTFVVGMALLVIALFWMGGGFYASDIPAIVVLIGLGLGLGFLGHRLNRDPDPTKAVAWKPTQPLQSEEPTAPLDDSGDTGEMMDCPNCGNPSRVGAGFCGYCGSRLTGPDPDPTPDTSDHPAMHAPSASTSPPPPPPPPGPSDATTVPEQPAPAAPQAEAASQGVAPADMITLPPGLVPTAPPAEQRPPTPPKPSLSDAVFITAPGAPQVVPRERPPVPPAEDDIDATRVATRRRAGSPWRLVLPDGRQHVVEGVTLVGRDPSPSAEWPDATLLAVDDPAKSVSKTHAVIEADSEGLWITDLASTNGVVVVAPDGTEADSDDETRLRIAPGSDIELGDYILQVEKDA